MKNKIKETVMLVIALIIVLIVLSAMNTYREPVVNTPIEVPNYEEYEYVPSNEEFVETPSEEFYDVNTNTNIN
jgi:hypothetical protein